MMRAAWALMHLQRLGIKGLLLLGVQRRVEGFGGLVVLLHTGLHLGLALAVQRLHGIDALGRGHAGKGRTVRTVAGGRALGLDGRGVRGPGSFLVGVELERGFERLQTLFPMRFTLLRAGAMALASGRCRCGGGLGAGTLGIGGYRKGSQHGRHDGAALQKRHGVSFLKGLQEQWGHCDGDSVRRRCKSPVRAWYGCVKNCQFSCACLGCVGFAERSAARRIHGTMGGRRGRLVTAAWCFSRAGQCGVPAPLNKGIACSRT